MSDEKLIEEAAKAIWIAHTPTGDERDDLAHLIRNAESDGPIFASTLADMILAAGFRRSEASEPQGESTDGERGWSTADRQAASDEAHRRFDEWAETRGQDIAGASINGFILGAEWWKSRRTVQGEADGWFIEL